jgi:homogentisate 1,2-dioxygenase
MHHYSQGKATRQAHKAIPEGYYEEEQGLKGFFGPVSHLIKKQPSTRWELIEGPLRPHMFDLVKLHRQPGFTRLLYNDSCVVGMEWVLQSDMPLGRRNADGDTLYFCHSGDGEILTEFGLLSYSKGSYIVVPKALTHTFLPKQDSNFLVVESRWSHYEEPQRGIVGRHAVYDINAIGKPDLDALHERLKTLEQPVDQIVVKRLDQHTRFAYDGNIYDTVGWKGDLFPFTLHVDHMMPLMSHRAHLPPSAHTTFVAKEFVVCTFLPRPLEKDDDALKVPFYHQNIDYDEVLFYHDGDFFSRDNLHAGMMSLHPAGFPHGPHPKATKSVKNKTETQEYAVMIDTRMPLRIDSHAESVELVDYWKSWKG